MTRDGAKRLVTILSVISNSPRHEEQLFKSEFKNCDDLEFINQIIGVLDSLSYDLNELLEEKYKNLSFHGRNEDDLSYLIE